MVLFVFIFNYVKAHYQNMAWVGLVFVPVYGTLNLISYSIQISIVPVLAKKALQTSANFGLVTQLIQANYKSVIGYCNGLAYAILGVPSIIYGILLVKSSQKKSGILLVLNGIFCIIGIAGYIMHNNFIALGTTLGGVAFLVSLFFMVREFCPPGLGSS
jgi:hypothetical protein